MLSLKSLFNFHGKTAVVVLGGMFFIIMGISGITHPIMTWIGPKSIQFYPPKMTLTTDSLKAIPVILRTNNISNPTIIKIVPSEKEDFLQITEKKSATRRYFNLDTYGEIQGQDKLQAIWLARYYTGIRTPIRNISLQTEFDTAYPKINRLLPVYKIAFDAPNNPVTYIYTETNALAYLTDDLKIRCQKIFIHLHTFKWLDGIEWLRVMIIGIGVLSILGLGLSGIAILIKKRKGLGPLFSTRRLHRFLGYFVSFSLLFFAISGGYHLIYSTSTTPIFGMKQSEPLLLEPAHFSSDFSWIKPYRDKAVNSVSIVRGPQNEHFYRIGIAQKKRAHKNNFDGIPSEKNVIYTTISGHLYQDLSDLEMAQHLAKSFTSNKVEIGPTTKVKRFGVFYDFRNKRLPVYKVETNSKDNRSLYIDTVSGLLVDQVNRSGKWERFSFSFFHKWNFLRGPLGRNGRDIVMVAFVLSGIFLSLLGFLLMWRNKFKKRDTP
ncbi:hypothetical protein DID80_04880 [Candidatus Marinamargulisbacteria bacterium SCGC AAA071-K20]|nr:hypothetical protein DID80_04880 [Candidatus Marinamargulisbacteria bacterium SCGC AAA071-K20]